MTGLPGDSLSPPAGIPPLRCPCSSSPPIDRGEAPEEGRARGSAPAGRHARARTCRWPRHGKLAQGRRWRANAVEAAGLLHARSWAGGDNQDGATVALGVGRVRQEEVGGGETRSTRWWSPSWSFCCRRPPPRAAGAGDVPDLLLPTSTP
jgi:hypothetical protein